MKTKASSPEVYAAFIRGINVGGNSIISMKDLVALCTELGIQEVRTYIQSGNIIYRSSKAPEKVSALLEKGIKERFGKETEVIIRDLKEVSKIVKNNPFPNSEGSKVAILLLGETIKKSDVTFTTPGKEEIKIYKKELFIYYPDGMGRSKLKLTLPKEKGMGTVRNLNTLTKVLGLMNDMK